MIIDHADDSCVIFAYNLTFMMQQTILCIEVPQVGGEVCIGQYGAFALEYTRGIIAYGIHFAQ
jgi:hypothetical protein